MTPTDRVEFYRSIASGLTPNGLFVNATLAADSMTRQGGSLRDVWMRMQRYAGLTDQEIEKMEDSFGKDIAIVSPDEIEGSCRSWGSGPWAVASDTV